MAENHMPIQNEAANEQDYNEMVAIRREKLKALQDGMAAERFCGRNQRKLCRLAGGRGAAPRLHGGPHDVQARDGQGQLCRFA